MSASSKYPGNYFRNFLEMLSVNYPGKRGRVDLNDENVNDLLLFFIHIEGEEEFRKLQQETGQILENKDLGLFRSATFKDVEDISFVAGIIMKKK